MMWQMRNEDRPTQQVRDTVIEMKNIARSMSRGRDRRVRLKLDIKQNKGPSHPG